MRGAGKSERRRRRRRTPAATKALVARKMSDGVFVGEREAVGTVVDRPPIGTAGSEKKADITAGQEVPEGKRWAGRHEDGCRQAALG